MESRASGNWGIDMRHRTVALGWMLVGGCVASNSSLGDDLEGSSGAQETTGSESGESSETNSDASMSSTSAATTSSTTEPSETEGETGMAAITHPACMNPFPDPAPALPAVNVAPDGSPLFSKWQDLTCADPSVQAEQSCSDDSECESNNCVKLGGAEGVCSYADIDIWCDGEGEVTGTSTGTCWICMPIEAHARACCDGIEGFDCRTWPFVEEPGIPGQVCALHEDCEAGLVCSETAGTGYGICACPGIGAIGQPDSCF